VGSGGAYELRGLEICENKNSNCFEKSGKKGKNRLYWQTLKQQFCHRVP
jgi:hypothetical protein